MDITFTIFLSLMVVLFFAFVNFDKLVKIEYRKYRAEWIKDGKPRGFFCVLPKALGLPVRLPCKAYHGSGFSKHLSG
jgi:hypothetical protein